jgi:hypothetical protein
MHPLSTPLPPPDAWPAIADELARRIEPATAVRDRHGMSTAALRTLLAQPTFRAMMREAALRWNGASNVTERLQQKGLHLLEANLPVLHDIMQDDRAAAAARVAAFKEVRGLTGVGRPDQDAMDANKKPAFVLQIVLGSGAKEPLTIEASTDVGEVTDADDGEA